MKTLLLAGVVVLGASTFAAAQDAPTFYAETYPEYALPSALDALTIFEGENAALDVKTRELIGLAVAAQIPCSYCAYYHRKAAEANGATEGEIREAVAQAASVRQWSTVLNGMQYDLEAFKAEADELLQATN